MATKNRPHGAQSSVQVPGVDAATELEVALASRPDRMLEDAVSTSNRRRGRSKLAKLWPGLEIGSALATGIGIGALALDFVGGLFGSFGALAYLAASATARAGIRTDPSLHPIIHAFEIDAPDIQAQGPTIVSGLVAAGVYGVGLWFAATRVGPPALYLLPAAVVLPVSSVMAAWSKSQQRWKELSGDVED